MTAESSSNRVVLLRGAQKPAAPVAVQAVALPPAPLPAERVEWLCGAVARNRFLPVPPAEKVFIGDGDFRAIGAEFLRHFITLGGLAPEESVLEIGCGIGRMAVPLTQYLTSGRYAGMDIVADGIAWCREAITPVYPNFRFEHLDLANPLYNPAGALNGGAVTLPFEAASFDFILLTSVITHLRTAEVVRYAAEMARVLRPGGRVFMSLFLMDNAARAGLSAGNGRYGFDPAARGPEYLGDPEVPNAAVAYDQRFLLDIFATQGLVPARPILHGHWSGRDGGGANFQDIVVLHREAGE